MFLALGFASAGNAQVTYDGNGAEATSANMAFTVPAGLNRLLVIALGHSGTVTDVSFNGTSASLAVSEAFFDTSAVAAIYYLPLGDGGPISSTITVTGGGNHHIKAASFQEVDQTTPYSGNSDGVNGLDDGPATSVALSVVSTPNNLVVDNILTSADRNPVPDSSQTDIASIDNASGNDYYSTFKIATGTPTAMSYSLDDASGGNPFLQFLNANYVYAGAEFNYDPAAAINKPNICTHAGNLGDDSARVAGPGSRLVVAEVRRLNPAGEMTPLEIPASRRYFFLRRSCMQGQEYNEQESPSRVYI